MLIWNSNETQCGGIGGIGEFRDGTGTLSIDNASLESLIDIFLFALFT